MNRIHVSQVHTQRILQPQMLAGILLLLALFIYVLMLFMTTMTLAEHKSISRDMKGIETEIAEYELNFRDRSHELSIAYALSQGFVEASSVTFISDAQPSTNVAMAGAGER